MKELLRAALATLLAGSIAAGGLALWGLEEFSRLPFPLSLGFPLLAGVVLGALIPRLSQALGAWLFTLIVSALLSALALLYPELTGDRLGLEVGLDLSLAKAIVNTILAAPLVLIGLLLGRLGRGEA